MPAQLAVLDVERHQRRCVEVVARPLVAVPVGARIAGAPVEQLERGIVRAGEPRRAAAALPGVALRPRIAARLVGRRNRVEAPEPTAGLRVVGVEEAADAGLAAAHADDDL